MKMKFSPMGLFYPYTFRMNVLAIRTAFLSSILTIFTPIALAKEPSAGINYLEIRTGSDNSTAGIYANGNMQAKLKITYELEDGYKFKGVKLKTRDEDIGSGWTISESENEFNHEILSFHVASFNLLNDGSQDDLDEDAQRAAEEAQPLPVADNRKAVFRYVSTSRMEQKKICAVLTVTGPKNQTSEKSTCVDNPETAGQYVNIIARQQKTYTLDDLNTYWDDSNHIYSEKFSGININARYTFHKWWLKPKNDYDLMIKKVVLEGGLNPEEEVGNGGVKIASQSPRRYKDSTGGGWPPMKDGEYQLDSALYLAVVNRGDRKIFPRIDVRDSNGLTVSNHVYDLSYANLNTENTINLFTIYGESLKKYGKASYGSFANISEKETPIQPKPVIFYDIYGNSGKFKIKRTRDWKVSDLGYEPVKY